MNKIFNLKTPLSTKKLDSGGIRIRGKASTQDIDRAGDVILKEAWEKGGLTNFKNNPVILFNHNHDLPIGKGTSIEPTTEGLMLEAEISRSAPNNIANLVEDETLKTFSVSFMIKDADYNDATGGLIIKDVELLEVSVVSIPCNQGATFELSKSFDSSKEYEEFVSKFKKDDDSDKLVSKKEEKSSKSTDNKSESPALSAGTEELNMDAKELQKLLADAVKQGSEATIKAQADAAKKAAEQADLEAKAAEREAKKSEALMAQLRESLDKDLEAIRSKSEATVAELREELEEKTAKLESMTSSKRVFGDRSNGVNAIKEYSTELLHAYMLGVMTDKGFETDYAKNVLEKAGLDYATTAPDIDQEVSSMIEKEIRLNLRTAGLFREIPVRGAATVLPIQPDVEKAVFQTGAATAGNLQNRGAADNTFKPSQVILNAYRLISQTYMDNHVDEEVLVDLMPMLVDSVARAHARAVDNAVINGDGSITGLAGYATASTATLSIGGAAKLTAAALVACRKQMGKYGINPNDVAYVVSQNRYYELIEDPEFQDITDVGSDVATKITGQIGAVYGSPVIVSDSFVDEAVGQAVAYAVATRNYAIPRLRGVKVERDYEVGNQRNVIVATQSLGFEELVPDTANNRSAIRINLVA